MTPSSHVFFLNFIVARALCPPSIQRQHDAIISRIFLNFIVACALCPPSLQQQQHDAIIARILPQFHRCTCALSTINSAVA